MVTFVKDLTGRFAQRPHYKVEELDRECEAVITKFLRERYSVVEFPVRTDDLTRLIEREAESLDLYADLTRFGPGVEGVTQFIRDSRPRVLISSELSENSRLENRLRTTLTHEYGHVHWHAYLFAMPGEQGSLLDDYSAPREVICKRDRMIDAPLPDWMEWQAGHICGAILMPAKHVKDLLRNFMETNNIYGGAVVGGEYAKTMVGSVVEQFQVSEQAARVRLLRLRLLLDGPSQNQGLNL